ncbi:glycosyltransferase family 2 protein [Acidiphilium acidophilum]|uniref:glycosyltransferase family 2 protein n=1 Tax=Acidiphilium acidophilum TaxID=76588 RepID=UPI002E8E6B19|nr:glycosyltransferase family 2 protein [Acidiphilium acidophilum]
MRVSVICPVYNANISHLRSAIRSVLEQRDFEVYEIILIDDHSTAPALKDALNGLVKENRKISLYQTPMNLGPSGARNLGLSKAAGDWIAFLDADDLWPSNKMELVHRALALLPDSRWLTGDVAELDQTGQIKVKQRFGCYIAGDDRSNNVQRMTGHSFSRSLILEGLHLGTSVIRYDCLKELLNFDEDVRYGEDVIFLVKLSLLIPADYIPNISYIYRRQTSSMMWSKGRLSSLYATGPVSAFQDPQLKAFRREFRWMLYSVYKNIAANNIINGRIFPGFQYALKAFFLDPRTILDLLIFTAISLSPGTSRISRIRLYSNSELILLDDSGQFMSTITHNGR